MRHTTSLLPDPLRDHFEPSDLTTYGAEDKEELRLILDAIDKVVSTDNPSPVTGLESQPWQALLSNP